MCSNRDVPLHDLFLLNRSTAIHTRRCPLLPPGSELLASRHVHVYVFALFFKGHVFAHQSPLTSCHLNVTKALFLTEPTQTKTYAPKTAIL